MMPKRKIPKFANEKAEAKWWDSNRAELDQDFLKASRANALKRLDKAALQQRIASATKVISIRMREDDLAIAREKAAARGLPYQTFLKSLLHQALRSEK